MRTQEIDYLCRPFINKSILYALNVYNANNNNILYVSMLDYGIIDHNVLTSSKQCTKLRQYLLYIYICRYIYWIAIKAHINPFICPYLSLLYINIAI